MQTEYASFGHLIKDLREALDLTQSELAQQVGYAYDTITKVEGGRRRPSKELTERLATTLNIPPAVRPIFFRLARSGTTAPPTIPLPAPLQPPAEQPPTLPVFLTPFRGREPEIARIVQLVTQDRKRLVTLTGLGGIGKTRLAAQIAALLANSFRAGAVFVDLTPIQDRALVLPTIARALGQSETAALTEATSLQSYLGDKHLLLVLDNCEQIPDLGPLLKNLLAHAPALTLLITSRATLRLPGEQVVPIRPFPVPPPNTWQVAELTHYSVIQLFVERAQEATGEFALDAHTASLVVQLCRQLEGIPLAIELAAAWLRLLPLEELLARLEQRIELLGGDPSTDRPARQAGLRAALAWSYELLPPAEQEVLAHLSVFVGSWTLAAAEAVLGRSLLASLRILAESNLIGHEAGRQLELRFTMLATVQEYAAEQLASPARAALRWAHARYYLESIEATYSQFNGPQVKQLEQWLTQLEDERDNLRAALSWMLEEGEYDGAAQLGGALVNFWARGDHISEGRQWLADALGTRAGTAPSWGRALAAAGFLAQGQADYAAAQAYLERSLPIWRMHGNLLELARTLRLLGSVLQVRGAYAQAASYYTESWSVYKHLDHKRAMALVQLNQARLAQVQGLAGQALQYYDEVLAIYRASGDDGLLAMVLDQLGQIHIEQQAYAAAIAALEEGRDLLRGLKTNRRLLIHTLTHLAAARTGQGQYDEALAAYQEAIDVWAELKDNAPLVDCLEGLSAYLVHLGNLRQAVYLLGFATHWRRSHQVDLEAHDAAAQIQLVSHLRTQLGGSDFDAAWHAGEHATLDLILAEIHSLRSGI